MAITGTQISNTVGILLNDVALVRWPSAERLIWINDGRREMASIKPTVFGNGTELAHVLTVGCKQRVSTTGAYKLVSVDSNVTSGKSIRVTTQDQLDAFKPAWRNDTATDVQNWFSDSTDPVSFWVYPASTGSIRLHAHLTPVDLASLTETALPFDQYAPVLINYVMFRALSKDDEAGAAQRAVAYYQAFTTALAPA